MINEAQHTADKILEWYDLFNYIKKIQDSKKDDGTRPFLVKDFQEALKEICLLGDRHLVYSVYKIIKTINHNLCCRKHGFSNFEDVDFLPVLKILKKSIEEQKVGQISN